MPGCHCNVGGAYENAKYQQNHFVEMDKDYLINLAAMPIKDKGMVNTMRVSEIE